jgi:paraquat-inducible protein A
MSASSASVSAVPVSPVACPVCGLVHADMIAVPGTLTRCVRCDAVLRRGVQNSLSRTLAFTLAALLLYFPANALPILTLELYGARSHNTVWDGVRAFFDDGDYVLAIVVLMASIVVPLIKLVGLLFVCITTCCGMRRWQKFRTNLFHAIDRIGRWAMLDVFVLSIWVALVKLGSLGSVSPGAGLLPFGCVVVLTLLASASFDPRLIWQPAPSDQAAA